MLSNAEKALRESSNTNAPIECWGCHGLFSDSNHLYKDCPHKYKPQVQEQFKRKLEEFLAKKKKNKFDPQTYKRDGFLTKQAVSLFNSINNPELDGTSRAALIQSFAAECNANGATRQSARHRKSPVPQDGGNEQGRSLDPALRGYAMPYWVTEESADVIVPDPPQDVINATRASSFKFTPKGLGGSIRYPITTELPHVDLPIGKQGVDTIEGLLDTGGACTMGNIEYWTEVSK